MTQGDSIADESWNSSCDTATRQRQQQEADKIAAALKTPIDLGAWHRAVNSGVYLYESRTMYISALYTPFDLGIALSTQVCLSTRVTNYLYTSPLHAAWHRAVNSGVFILRVTNYLYASPLHACQFLAWHRAVKSGVSISTSHESSICQLITRLFIFGVVLRCCS